MFFENYDYNGPHNLPPMKIQKEIYAPGDLYNILQVSPYASVEEIKKVSKVSRIF